VTIKDSTITDSHAGIYVLSSQAISITGNRFTDAGRNFVQFDKVTGAGNKILFNSGSNQLGASNAEDLISIYKSSGTSESPIEIRGNNLSNGGPSSSGSGIMVGDGGGANIVVEDNTLSNPGQAGIGVAGGQNIRILANTVYSAPQPWSNVGIYVWNQSDQSCSDIEVQNNRVQWYNADGNENPKWNSGNCGTVTGWANNDWQANIN
jgi:hypothetical protein